MQHARSIKNEDEVACLKHAAAIADAAHHRIAQTIEPGAKETDIQAAASAIMRRDTAPYPWRPNSKAAASRMPVRPTSAFCATVFESAIVPYKNLPT